MRVELLHVTVREQPRQATLQGIYRRTSKSPIATSTSKMAASTEAQSKTMSDADERLVQILTRHIQHLDSVNHSGQHHQDSPNAAARVFGIPELLEQILLEANDPHALRTTLPLVSKTFQQTILGSIKLQRTRHGAPDWTHPTLLPAPIPTRMLAFPAHKDYTFGYANAPTINAHNRLHILNLRFDRDALAWASDRASTTNGPFRAMFVSQPPPVFLEIFCWSNTADYKARVVETRVMNAGGVTCGQMFDLVRAAEPIGGNVRASLWFGSKSV